MTDEIPFWENFEDEVEREPVDDPKIEEHIIWHEIGHLIGYVISKEYDFDFGKITEIKLNYENKENPCICFESDIFRPRYQKLINPISLGVVEFLYDSKDQERLRKNLSDTRGFLMYSIYLLMGGLFNIYALKKDPSEEDFRDCFYDDITLEQSGSFIAKAGNDWTKLRSLIQLKSWSEEVFIEYRMELFYLLRKFNIFELFRDFIQKTVSDFNGKVIQQEKVNDMMVEISSVLKTVEGFRKGLDGLVSETQGKLITK